MVFIDDNTLHRARADDQLLQQLERSVSEHLSALISHVFLHSKPARPSQSRWTGVANVAEWCLGLALFHQFLTLLFGALSAKAGSNTADSTMDVDVMASIPGFFGILNSGHTDILATCDDYYYPHHSDTVLPGHEQN